LATFRFHERVNFDYILVTAKNETTLEDQTILLDDSSVEIQWNGSWESRQNVTATIDPSPSFPDTVVIAAHGNGTHVSSKEGESTKHQKLDNDH
jgi:hypothetical protein